jgi:hypothetical protein
VLMDGRPDEVVDAYLGKAAHPVMEAVSVR